MSILECVAAFFIFRLRNSMLKDSFQQLSAHSCLHYALHICICFHLGGSPGSATDVGKCMY